jgi:hypothetical protein
MIEYIRRFSLKTGQAKSFQRWLKKNEGRLESPSKHGWKYAGTYFTVFGLASYDCETRWVIGSLSDLEKLRDSAIMKDFMTGIADFVNENRESPACILKSSSHVHVY